MERADQGDAQPGADRQAEDGAEQGDDDGLPGHHLPSLAAGHPHGPEQPQFPGPLQDAQRKGVDDADDGDEDRQPEQDVDQVEEGVEPGRDQILVLRPGEAAQLRIRPQVVEQGGLRGGE